MIIAGVMSGTSLDGLDIALCSFSGKDGKIAYQIIKGQTISYDSEWKSRLASAHKLSGMELSRLDMAFGQFIGQQVSDMLAGAPCDAVASHGHTVFHQPDKGFTTQIGHGAAIAAASGLTTVCDFRSLDVALGGQGAPLVPIGDRLLFSEFDACLNIGGIANISFDDAGGVRKAFDICVANMALNDLAGQMGKVYDDEGRMAAGGTVNEDLLDKLNDHSYFRESTAKSLGREWYESEMRPLLTNYSTEDLLATVTRHSAEMIADTLNKLGSRSVLVTGGGAYNSFLLESVKQKTSCVMQIPSKQLVELKEALVFALLGYLRLNKRINTYSSVTGARCDSSGGSVYHHL